MLSLRGPKGTGGGAQGWVGCTGLGIEREAWAGGGDPGIISLKRSQEAGELTLGGERVSGRGRG